MRRLFVLSAVLVVFLSAPCAHAMGHEGFFVGGGYEQLFMYTPEDQLRAAGQIQSSQIVFGPGFGAHLVFGFDFKDSRWGVQMPFEYSYLKLNRIERVHYIGSSLEGIVHLASWKSGLDINFVGGAGWSVLPEGPVDNNTGTIGINFGIGPGLSYFFAKDKNKASVYAQIPLRMIYFFGSNLSAKHTTVLAVPVKIGLSVGF